MTLPDRKPEKRKPLEPDDPRWQQAQDVAGRLRAIEARNRARARAKGARYEKVDFVAVVIAWNGCCCICQQEIDLLLPGTVPDGLTLEHQISLGQGGHHLTDNVAPAHRRCNFAKNHKTDTRKAAKIRRLRGETGQQKRLKERGKSSIPQPRVSPLSKKHPMYRKRSIGK